MLLAQGWPKPEAKPLSTHITKLRSTRETRPAEKVLRVGVVLDIDGAAHESSRPQA